MKVLDITNMTEFIKKLINRFDERYDERYNDDIIESGKIEEIVASAIEKYKER